jgi:DNA-binding transcriptional regulator YhcF (GntR family)
MPARSPIYRQIADQVKAGVVGGDLDGDEQVMSTNQYAAYYRINPATVAKAFQQLVDEQVLYKKQGIGMFVSPTARDAALEVGPVALQDLFVHLTQPEGGGHERPRGRPDLDDRAPAVRHPPALPAAGVRGPWADPPRVPPLRRPCSWWSPGPWWPRC